MKDSLEKELIEKYPLLYGRSFSFFEIDGDGWFKIIDKLSSKLEKLIKKWIAENPDATCLCGERKEHHLNGVGKCTIVYKYPIQIHIKRVWIPPKKKFKSFRVSTIYAINNFINSFLYWLYEKNILFHKTPSSCEGFQLDYPHAFSVKEKFGGLRVSLTDGTDKMYEVIRDAEKESFRTCEYCSSEVIHSNKKRRGWIKTLCEKCQ